MTDAYGLILGLVIIACGAGLVWLAWIGSQRRLPPTSWIGLRTRSVRSSDASWYSAHEAAAAPLGITGGVTACLGLAVLVTGFDLPGQVAAATAAGVIVVGTTISGVAGVRAVEGRRSDG